MTEARESGADAEDPETGAVEDLSAAAGTERKNSARHESRAPDATPGVSSGSRWRLALPAIGFAMVFATLLLTLHLSGILEKVYDKDALRAWVADQGALAPLVYVGLLIVRPFTFFPSTLLAPVAFALFGVAQGAFLKVCGETCGSTLACIAARVGIRDSLAKLFARQSKAERDSFGKRLNRLTEHRGMRTVLMLRFNLLIPFDAVNYGLGLTKVPIKAFFFGTILGILPGTYLYVALAGSALEGEAWSLAFVLVALAVMVWLSIPLARDLLRGEKTEPRD